MIDNTEPIREFDKDIIHNKINELYPFPLNDKKVEINQLFIDIDKSSNKSDIDKYKEKLQIWKEEELSPLQIQHLFKIDNFDKKLVLSICPQTENEKTEYFKWLVDYLNNIIYDKFIKIFDFKLIKTEELVSNRNINQIKLLIKSKIQSKNVYKNHKIFKKDNFLLSEIKLNNQTDLIYTIQITALEIAFVLNELEAIYILENDISTIDESLFENIKFINNRSFKTNLNEEDLSKVFEFLKDEYFHYDEKSKNHFINLFSNKEIKGTNLIWKKKAGKNYDLQSILVIIKVLCEFDLIDFKTYKDDIYNRIKDCFDYFGFVMKEDKNTPSDNISKNYLSITNAIFKEKYKSKTLDTNLKVLIKRDKIQ